MCLLEFILMNQNFYTFNAHSKIHTHIKKSSKKSLIGKFSKRLLELEFKSSHSIKSKCLKRIVKYMLPTLENMQTYCLMCKKHTNNIGSKKVIMKNKGVRHKPRCANCMSNKSRFLKQKLNKKSDWNNINTKLFVYYHYKTC